MTEQPIWQPNPQSIKDSQLSRFTDFVNHKQQLSLSSYSQLHQYSIENRALFWRDIIDFCDVIYHQDAEHDLQDDGHMIDARWFQGMTLNFAENLLRKNDDDAAIAFSNEQGQTIEYSYRQLNQKVAQIQQKLKQCGIKKGDRVVGFMPNIPETITAMLAATSLGAVWSSTSPDFGINGVVDRFGQIAPKVMFCANAYYYNGKTHDCLEKVKQISDQINSIEHIVVVDFVKQTNGALPPKAVYLDDFLAGTDATAKVKFTPVPFDHPLYILYSSGTTGKPKCIVHRTGGVLLQHLKELQIHSNVTVGKKLFYFTTCGWTMWNWLVSGLATGATVMLYDGSPFYPDGNRLFDLIDDGNITHFGTSAKWISAVEKAGLKPRKSHNLQSLETIFSTGSPLLPENFDFVYQNIKADVCLSSISGGTDICSCFALGCSDLPVYRGQLQCLGLGLSVKVLDDNQQSLIGEPGELACDKAFPAMPVYFWDDKDNEKYMAAYFDKYPDIWCHSDRAEITPQGGMIIYGRSDTTLNPGGVRIGTAEIYRQVEKHPEILESIVVGQDWDNDSRVILFVVMQTGFTLDDDLIKQIKTTIRQNTTPRHVPAKIIAVSDIPKTISGKMVELAVRDVIHGKPVANTDALANPEALDLYKNLAELEN